MKSRSVAIFAVVVAVLVSVSIWYLMSDWAAHAPVVTTTPTPAPAPKPEVRQPDSTGNDPAPPVVVKAPPKAAPVPAPEPPPITEDDRKIATALEAFPGDSDADHDRTAGLLISLLPSLSKDSQVECAQHITNLISDGQFLNKLMPIWRNASFNPDVLQVIGDDLNNRSNNIKMPAWMDAVRNPAHPYHEEAKGNLEVYLDEDYGTNVAKWDSATKAFLAKEAKEEAEAEK
jgi:hypothetical protein